MSLPNRLINMGLFALAFARPIQILFGGGSLDAKAQIILSEATGGLAGTTRKFNMGVALGFYGPVAASFILFEVKKLAMKKFRF